MTTWDCKVVDRKGNRTHMVRSAENRDWVIKDLHQEGYVVTSVTLSASASPGVGRSLSRKEVLEFTKSLSTLMGNGLSLQEALEVASSLPLPAGQKVLATQLAVQVEKGVSLHQSLASWGKSFSPFFRGMVKIGERTGDLSPVLGQLSEYLWTQKVLQEKTGNALLYPALVLAVATIGLGMLSVFVLPALLEVVSSVNATAAAGYASTIASFQSTTQYLVLMIILSLLIVQGILWRARSSASLALTLGRVAMRLPLWKQLKWATFGWNFAFAMETLLQAGATVEESLQQVSDMEPNPWIRSSILSTRKSILGGMSFSKAMESTRAFPSLIVAWVAVGEGAHDLRQSFSQLKGQYRQMVDSYHARYISLVEPGLIVVVGGLLVVLILNFIAPFFQMMGTLT